MSRPAQLPPRCPLQDRGPSTRAVDSLSITKHRDDALQVQHHRFPSQGSLFEDQPLWFDDLLGEPETNHKCIFHRRSASDSVAILEVPSTFHSSTSPADKEIPISTAKHTDKNEACCGLEAGCIYGPNSPRRSTLTLSESSIVSKLLENVPWNPLQYVATNPHASEICQSNVKGDACVVTGDFQSDETSRRHSGQRSRVRKLQYIAELERIVNVFQTMQADLGARVASLFQQHAVLSVENRILKQRISSLCQEKVIKDGQYQSLENEIKRLKTVCGRHRESKSTSCFRMDPIQTDTLESSWQMLDMGKLNLGGNPVPVEHAFRS